MKKFQSSYIKKTDKNMFTLLCVIQTVTVIVIALLLFALSRLNPSYFERIENDIEGIFSKNYDLGGYFTPSEEKEYFAASALVLEDEGNEDIPFITVIPAVNNFYYDIKNDYAVMPVTGTVTSGYGYRIHPIYGTESFHTGIDIAAAEGSPIYSVFDGKVIDAGTAPQAGNYVKIDHGNSLVTLYCHCSEIYAEKGSEVSQGDIIAAVGQTGLATGPHVHFEVHENGEVTDPDIILRDAVNVY